MNLRKKSEIFKALSEPNRIRILLMLLKKPLCVCEITSILGLSTATVSNHLSILRNSGFIIDEKHSKWINYKINKQNDNPIIKNILDNLIEWFKEDIQIKSDLESVIIVDRYSISCNTKNCIRRTRNLILWNGKKK